MDVYSCARWRGLLVPKPNGLKPWIPPAQPLIEDHRASYPYLYEHSDAARLRTDLEMAAHEAAYTRHRADSSVRQLAEGQCFTLSQHANYQGEAARFSVLRIEHAAANQPCPEAGWWFTPARPNSRRYFKQGDTMPSVGGDYGNTFWQWSPDQSPPSL